MTRTKKSLVAAAFTVALGLGAAAPALADSHMTGDTHATVVTPQDNTHATVVTPQDNTHATVVTPQDENHVG
ncbi:hypothetical protein ACFCV8_06630 [Streptomyces sp. NPDC056347]|uniref:hypothetical protein n=1 Tax=Streptomyces sp. NPDC056347 TaxID=3345790 RepID=UPI0035DC9AA7